MKRVLIAVLVLLSVNVNAANTLPDNWRSFLPLRDKIEVELAIVVEQVKLGKVDPKLFSKLPLRGRVEISLLIALTHVNTDMSVDAIWSEIKLRRLFDELEEKIQSTR